MVSFGQNVLQQRASKGQTLLHLAVRMKQFKKIELLLNYKELVDALSNNTLTQEEYTDFVNTRTFNNERALDLLLTSEAVENADNQEKWFARDIQNHLSLKVIFPTSHSKYSHAELKECILLLLLLFLFLGSSFYDPNQSISTIQRMLPSVILDFLDSLFAIKAKIINPNLDWSVKDPKGETPLKLSCIEKNPKKIEILQVLQAFGANINPNEYTPNYAIDKYLEKISYEHWLGEDVRIIDLSLSKLSQLLKDKKPLEVQVMYKKIIHKLKIDLRPKTSTEIVNVTDEYIQNIIEFTFDYIQNKEKMKCCNNDYTKDPNFLALCEKLREMENSHWWLKKNEGEIEIYGRTIKISEQSSDEKIVQEYREITYKFFVSKLPKELKTVSGEIKPEHLEEKHGSIITYLLANNDIESFREYMEFSGINFDKDILIDSLLDSKSEFKKIFDEAKKRKGMIKF